MKRQANLKFIASATVSEIASALLDATDLRAESALKFDRVLPLSLDLRTLFRAEPRHRAILAQSIVKAITDWSSAYSLDGLAELALSAAYVRASDAAPALARILDTGRIRKFQKWETTADDETREVVGKIVQVIAGFAPNTSVRLALERWLHDPRFQPAYAAVLATGLCACDPDSYKHYMLQFLEIAGVFPENYEVDAVLQEISRTVGVPRIARDLEEWDLPLYERVLNALAGYRESPARIGHGEGGPILVVVDSEIEIPHNISVGEKCAAFYHVDKRRMLRDDRSWPSRMRAREERRRA